MFIPAWYSLYILLHNVKFILIYHFFLFTDFILCVLVIESLVLVYLIFLSDKSALFYLPMIQTQSG